jgi:hypothetical protein
MSMPPPPDMIAGVEAKAAIANGAKIARVVGQLDGLAKLGCEAMFAISSTANSTSAKV